MGLLPTKVTKRNVSIQKLRWLLMGATKIGKTTLLSGFPDLVLLATEKNYYGHDFFVVNIVSWKKEPALYKYGPDENGVQNVAFVEMADELTKGDHPYKTVSIDTIDMLTTLCVDYVCRDLKIKHVSDLGYAKAYDRVKNELNNELNKLFMSDCGLIFTSHIKEREIITTSGSRTKISSNLSNQARDVVYPKVSAIGHMKVKMVKVGEGKYEEKRVISFKPSELEEVGERDEVLPVELLRDPDSKKTYEAIKKCYEQNNK